MGKRVFITGATGFVGGALAERLSLQDFELIALVREGSDCKRLVELGVTLVYGDLTDYKSFSDSLKDCDTVFHCAALTGIGHSIGVLHSVISIGTQNLLRAAISAEVNNFIYISSILAYELTGDHKVYDEKQPLLSKSLDPYGSAKVEAEKACWEAHAQGDIEVCVVRPGFIYGPGDRDGGFMPETLKMLKNGKFRLIGEGRNIIPLIYITDLIDLLLRCSTSEKSSGQSYNANSGELVTWKQFTETLAKKFGFSSPKSVSPKVVGGLAGFLELLARTKLIRTLPLSISVVNLLSRDILFPAEKASEELECKSNVYFEQGLGESMPMLENILDRSC